MTLLTFIKTFEQCMRVAKAVAGTEYLRESVTVQFINGQRHCQLTVETTAPGLYVVADANYLRVVFVAIDAQGLKDVVGVAMKLTLPSVAHLIRDASQTTAEPLLISLATALDHSAGAGIVARVQLKAEAPSRLNAAVKAQKTARN